MLEHFKIKTIGLISVITLLITAVIYSFFQAGFNIYIVVLIPILIALVWRLFSLIDKTNTEVASFLANIKYNDYATSFPEKKSIGDSYQRLHGAFNLVTEKFRDIRSEKEAQFQYLQAIVENVDSGLICFDQQGKTILMNRALQQLLRKSYFPYLRSLQKFNHALYDTFLNIQPGERQLVRLIVGGEILQLAVRKTILKMKDDELNLYALHNIHKELEEHEITSWQKLIRILTHEIMNSIAPVISLASTAHEIVRDKEFLSPEECRDVGTSLHAIKRRSTGLLNFAQNYRQLTKIPLPKFENVILEHFIDELITLFKPKLNERGVDLSTHFPSHSIKIQIDPALMEQVLINLINNAMDAIISVEQPKIEIHAFRSSVGELEIEVHDNGPGISADILDQIFVPFFTTKKEGSGIGLSLCRQIVHLHKGELHVSSQSGKGSVFTIKF